MKTFKYIVVLQVEVDAYLDEDARDVLLDTFGPGEDGGIKIEDVTIKGVKWSKYPKGRT